MSELAWRAPVTVIERHIEDERVAPRPTECSLMALGSTRNERRPVSTRHHLTAATAMVAAIAFTSFGLPLRVQSASAPPIVAEASGIDQFDRQVTKYLAVLAKVRAEFGDMAPSSTAVQLNDASDMLAAALVRARPQARQGDFFNAAVSRTITRRIADASRAGRLRAVIARIDDEGPSVGQPRVHLRFPSTSEMATMPPSLLEVVPRLPNELEYRIIGEFLVLRDVSAALILDYIARAVPRR